MITDVHTHVHTHVGEYPAHISERFVSEARAAWLEVPLGTGVDDYHTAALAHVDREDRTRSLAA